MSLRSLSIESDLLRGNPLGDPHARELPVYLPPGYESEPGRSYPVVCFLAGYTGTGPMLLNHRGGWGESTPQRLDRLIRAGEVPPLIGIFPDCWTRWGGSQYVDSTATGPYMSHIVDELLPAVDGAFRTIPEASGRAVTGISSGGYGALMLALERPGTFGLILSTAGDCAFDLCYRPDLARAAMTLEQAGGVEPFLEAFFEAKTLGGAQIGAMMVLAMATCYSPNLDRPPVLADLPMDLRTAELIPDVWARWLAFDPVNLVEERADALAGLDLLALDAGLSDEHALQFGARILSDRLTRIGISHTLEEFPGGHRGLGYRQEQALARIGEVIATG
jgi:enterochelin esterase-like enzyme